jgi:hypothetical protein
VLYESRDHQLTVRVDDIIGGSLPLALGQELYDDDIPSDRAVHALESDEKNGLVATMASDGSLPVQESARKSLERRGQAELTSL